MKDMRLCAFCGNSSNVNFSYCPFCGVPLKNLDGNPSEMSALKKKEEYSKRLDNLKIKLDEMEKDINHFLSVRL